MQRVQEILHKAWAANCYAVEAKSHLEVGDKEMALLLLLHAVTLYQEAFAELNALITEVRANAKAKGDTAVAG